MSASADLVLSNLESFQVLQGNMNPVQKFSTTGIPQAALAFAILLLLTQLGGPMVGAPGWWDKLAGAAFRGPIYALLFDLNISNEVFYALWLLSLPFYWLGLGILVGEVVGIFFRPEAKAASWLIWLGIAGLAVVFGIFTEMGMAKLSDPSPHHSVSLAIVNNLRQIDAAKNEFALEKKVSPNYVPTEPDLLLYIKPNKAGKFPHVGTERYVFNSINEAPYAVLDNGWRFLNISFSVDWSRVVFTNGTVIRLD